MESMPKQLCKKKGYVMYKPYLCLIPDFHNTKKGYYSKSHKINVYRLCYQRPIYIQHNEIKQDAPFYRMTLLEHWFTKGFTIAGSWQLLELSRAVTFAPFLVFLHKTLRCTTYLYQEVQGKHFQGNRFV